MAAFNLRTATIGLGSGAIRNLIGDGGTDPGDDPWMIYRHVRIENKLASAKAFNQFLTSSGGIRCKVKVERLQGFGFALNLSSDATINPLRGLFVNGDGDVYEIQQVGPAFGTPPEVWASFAGTG